MGKINEYISGVTYHLTDTIPLNVYLVKGELGAVMIDSGINKMHESLIEMASRSGYPLMAVLNTHSHHDHIGGNAFLKEKTGCEIVAPKTYAHWHHDWEAHYQEFARPFPSIFPDSQALQDEVLEILDAPHRVDRFCKEGDLWSLGGGIELECWMFSGHMLEEAGWLEKKTRTLILGDVITLLDAPFIHGHLTVSGYRSSLKKLKKMAEEDRFETVLMAHFPPMDKTAFYQLIERAMEYINLLDNTILELLQSGASSLEKIWISCIERLGKQEEFRSLSTVFAHLKDFEERGMVLKLSNGEFSKNG
jgi:glyoxylase-like metal-dependent hydrolase (beta-lactamase superfamily II)